MARGRMISKSWSTSKKRAAIYREAGPLAEFCLQLFPLLVVHSDDYGRFDGDPESVKLKCDPGSPRGFDDFETALGYMSAVGLIQLYTVDGQRWLQVRKFDEHQPGLLSKRSIPRSPAAPLDTESDGNSGPTQPNLTELNLTQPKGNLTELPPAAVSDSGEKASQRSQRASAQHSGRASAQSLLDERFDRFWAAYPRKVDKVDARREFMKIAPDDTLLGCMLAALDQQRASAQWLKDDGQYIPHPRTWLHKARWQDEVSPRSLVSDVTRRNVAGDEEAHRLIRENEEARARGR